MFFAQRKCCLFTEHAITEPTYALILSNIFELKWERRFFDLVSTTKITFVKGFFAGQFYRDMYAQETVF